MSRANQLEGRSPITETLWAMKKAWIGIGVLSFFVNLLMLTGPLYMLQVYDRVIASQSISTLVALSVLMIAMYAFMGSFDFLRSRILVRIGNYTEAELGQRTFHVWLKQGLYGKAAAKHQPLKDLAAIKQFLTGAAPITFFDVPWTPIYIAVIFMLDWTLGVFATVGAIIVLIIALAADFATRKSRSEAQKATFASDIFAEQCHNSSEAVIAMGMAGNLITRWSNLQEQGANQNLFASDVSGSASAFSKAFRMFMQSAILGMGAALAIQQIVSPGAMIAGSIILGRALAPIQMIIGQWRNFVATKSAYVRLNTFYALIPEDEKTTQLPPPTGHIRVEGVNAGPPASKKATIKGLRFEALPGDGLCVLGPSGSGKSTLARLLVGVWFPQIGTVRLDGATYDQWDRDEIGKYIGYLPQKIDLFNGTVAENITRFRPDIQPSAAVEAAQLAGVHELILNLPEGYNTRIGEGGEILSVGQTQRVALARALCGNPCLVVMDEPNSNLDAQGDEALNQAIMGLRQRGKTVIVITHRQSAMEVLNKVLILRNGTQVKFGLKENLIQKSPAKTPPSSTNVQPHIPQRDKPTNQGLNPYQSALASNPMLSSVRSAS